MVHMTGFSETCMYEAQQNALAAAQDEHGTLNLVVSQATAIQLHCEVRTADYVTHVSLLC